MAHARPGRWVYVVFGKHECDCSPSCPLNHNHIWAIVGSELAARKMCDGHTDMWWEAHRFNDRVVPGHRVEVID